jgi:regulator of sirC expression with transglutaminase-like and TPR domain
MTSAMDTDPTRRGYGPPVDATERFTELVRRPDGAIPLDEAALLIAAHARPGLEVDTQLARLDDLAAGAPAGPEPSAATALAQHLFVDLGFAGNRDDYSDPANSYLDRVLERRLGIPITLSVLMIEIGRRNAVPLEPVGMPGHFLVGGAPGEWFDPFNAGVRLDLAGCARRFAETQGAARLLPEHLEPTPRRRVLERMLSNLQHVFVPDRSPDAVWVTRLRLALPDLSPSTRGQLAALLGELGQFTEAAAQLDVVAGEIPGEGSRRAAAAATRLRARAN